MAIRRIKPNLELIKKIVTDNPGISSREISQLMGWQDDKKGELLRATRTLLGREDWLFIQTDSTVYRWFSASYAAEHKILSKINTKDRLSGPEERDDRETTRMMAIINRAFGQSHQAIAAM